MDGLAGHRFLVSYDGAGPQDHLKIALVRWLTDADWKAKAPRSVESWALAVACSRAAAPQVVRERNLALSSRLAHTEADKSWFVSITAFAWEAAPAC